MDEIDETNLAKADLLNAGADLAAAENGWRQYVIDMDKRLMNSGPQDEREALIQTQIKALSTRHLQKENLENAELKKRRKKRQTQVEQDLLTILATNRN